MCDFDPIPTTLLKSILPGILPAISRIINLSLQSGVLLRSWKTTIVTPLLKKHGMDLVKSSYRPVSNLSYISKLVEKAMLEQIFTVFPITHYWITGQHTGRTEVAKQYCPGTSMTYYIQWRERMLLL